MGQQGSKELTEITPDCRERPGSIKQNGSQCVKHCPCRMNFFLSNAVKQFGRIKKTIRNTRLMDKQAHAF